MRIKTCLSLLLFCFSLQNVSSVMLRGEHPWNVVLKSSDDAEMQKNLGTIPFLLNLGPTGIRARIYPEKPKHLVVKYVFQDKDSPAKGLVNIEDVIVGANGKKFKTSHRFGRNLTGGGGWDGPMMELAGHLEDSQGTDGKLKLMVWPKGEQKDEKEVIVPLKVVGRFAATFPYDCKRSEVMLEELCDFIVKKYEESGNKFGRPHANAHQMLALMASGNKKYNSLLKNEIRKYYDKRYDPYVGGFQMWNWGFDGIVMGEYYLLNKDRKLLKPIESLTEAMPLGSHMGNGIYTHRSYLTIMAEGKKPYASIAGISGLQKLAMSLFHKAGLEYDKQLHQKIHQHFLNSATPDTAQIAYAFNNADRFNDSSTHHRHAIIKLKNPSKSIKGKGPGHVLQIGMTDFPEYEVFWPTKKDPRWKPLDWLAKEADTNIVTELKDKGSYRVDRANPKYKQAEEPKKPYKTTRTGTHLAPVGMGALSHLIGTSYPKSWEYLGHHLANTCALRPGNAFDGHASSNLAAFWSVLGAAKSSDPKMLREYLDYMKTFVILSETHNGGLILQPWGRDRPNKNSDPHYGARTLPTATGAILLALGQRHLQITGAGSSDKMTDNRDKRDLDRRPRKARSISKENHALLNKGLVKALASLNRNNALKPHPISLSKARSDVWLAKAEDPTQLTFQAMAGDKQAAFDFADLTIKDHAELAILAATQLPENQEYLAFAGVYSELTGATKIADSYYEKVDSNVKEKIDQFFEQ